MFAYKDKERKTEGQLIEVLKWLRLMYPKDISKKAGVVIKFLLGERVRSPWIIKFVEDLNDLSKVEDVVVDIVDKSDMPELTKATLSKRARKLIRERKKGRKS